jgi:NAD(P)H dehydrogenase (quinone)
MAWNPISDRGNFSTVVDPVYLKQQVEEQHASKEAGFTTLVESEIQKLEACDLLIFSFPLWWYGLPAILKGWVDRVFAMGRIYGGGKYYENGLGKAQKRAMVIMTTGGSAASFSQFGTNLSLDRVLAPIEHGIFWFNGFLPLDPFVAWNPARMSPEERQALLFRLDERLRRLEHETPRQFPLRGDFGADGLDKKRRFLVLATRHDGTPHLLFPTSFEIELAELKRAGLLLRSHWGTSERGPGKGILVFREASSELVRRRLSDLGLAAFYDFEVVETDLP